MKSTDFIKGPVWKCILAQSVPMMIAQLVHLLYNVVDRIYIGHMEGTGAMALTGVGLTFPVATLIMAFAALFGMGGVPLFSIARGSGNDEEAKKIMGNSFFLLLVSSSALMVIFYIFRGPVLFAFGASPESFIYADEYLRIYLAGAVFSAVATGMNGYINAQGFPRVGMLSVIIGAAVNIALDPLFIFGFGMGIGGAALATVISQALSALWVLAFLFGRRSFIHLERRYMKPEKRIFLDILRLGTSNFVMQGTTFLVQIACNSTLQQYGGDMYVGIMTVTNSVRDIFMLPVSGITSGAGPVLSYNYGAKRYDRVRAGIRFNTFIGLGYTVIAWMAVLIFPGFWFGIFSDDPSLATEGIGLLRTYFFGFAFMAFQFAGQSAFQALGDAKHAIIFSLLRKVVIVIPLTFLLPALGLGAGGVFMAEPISNIAGGSACYITMMLTAYRRMKRTS
ncbi:MAG: MATE family efflux transporter [Clostridia bacterium]|nr:MATE family efflux transporter [Clostridia bacterium]